MTRRTRKFLLLLGLIVVGSLALAFGAILFLGHVLRPFAPYEYTEKAAAVFRAEFPPIYHFLVADEDYDAVLFRVQHGLGGRWGKLTLTRKAGATTDREAAATRLRRAFEEAGWQAQTDSPIIIGTNADLLFGEGPYPHTPDDLKYSRRHPDELIHNCRVFISEDGGEIVAYCEMSW